MLPVFSLLEVMKREKKSCSPAGRQTRLTAGQRDATPQLIKPLLPGHAGGQLCGRAPVADRGHRLLANGDGAGGPARERAGMDGQDGTGCATSALVPAERCDGPRAFRALRYLALLRWHTVTVGLHFPLVAARLRAGTAPGWRASSGTRRLRPAASPTLCCHGCPQLPHTTQATTVPTPLFQRHLLRCPGSLWVVREAELAFLPRAERSRLRLVTGTAVLGAASLPSFHRRGSGGLGICN